MKKKISYLLALLLICPAIVLIGCMSRGMGPNMGPHMVPSENAASIGGKVYDNWWITSSASEPTTEHLLWSLQDTNSLSGSATWRCKECHGWDYKGKDGAYGEGSHLTGFLGVYEASKTMDRDQLMDVLKGSTDERHDFSLVLTEAVLEDVVVFLDDYVIDDAKYLDYDTKKVIDVDNQSGRQLYSQLCSQCHGIEGKRLNFGSEKEPEYVGTLANNNPWEVLHKIRFGNPGTNMPASVVAGWSIRDVLNILGYAQQLP